MQGTLREKYYTQIEYYRKLVTFLFSKLRIPNYSGHIPTSYRNQKGNLREECFSTKGENYN